MDAVAAPEPITRAAPRDDVGPVVLRQRWTEVAFLHWPADPAVVAPLLPAGTRPDVFDGSTWIGLIAFVMRDVRAFGLPKLPYVSDFRETNVRLYAVDGRGRRSVVFLSLDADRALPVTAARAGFRLNYIWSRMSFESEADERRYVTARRRGSARSTVRVRVQEPVAPTPFDDFVTARWALHQRFWGGRTTYVPITHEPWPLHAAKLLELDDGLVTALGLPAPPPDPVVRFSPGVSVRIGPPRR